jgi:hypothetical protein
MIQPDDPGQYARNCLRCGLDEGLGSMRLCTRCDPPEPFWAHLLRMVGGKPCAMRRWVRAVVDAMTRGGL